MLKNFLIRELSHILRYSPWVIWAKTRRSFLFISIRASWDDRLTRPSAIDWFVNRTAIFPFPEHGHSDPKEMDEPVIFRCKMELGIRLRTLVTLALQTSPDFLLLRVGGVRTTTVVYLRNMSARSPDVTSVGNSMHETEKICKNIKRYHYRYKFLHQSLWQLQDSESNFILMVVCGSS